MCRPREMQHVFAGQGSQNFGTLRGLESGGGP